MKFYFVIAVLRFGTSPSTYKIAFLAIDATDGQVMPYTRCFCMEISISFPAA